MTPASLVTLLVGRVFFIYIWLNFSNSAPKQQSQSWFCFSTVQGQKFRWENNTFLSFLFLFFPLTAGTAPQYTRAHTHTGVVIVAVATGTPASTAAALRSRAIWAPQTHKNPNVCRRCCELRGRTTSSLRPASAHSTLDAERKFMWPKAPQFCFGFFFFFLVLGAQPRFTSEFAALRIFKSRNFTADFFTLTVLKNEWKCRGSEWAEFHPKGLWYGASFNLPSTAVPERCLVFIQAGCFKTQF